MATAESAELELGFRPVSEADVDTRAKFILKTYSHLLGAVAAFTALEVFFFMSGLAVPIAQTLFKFGPLPVLGGFILVSWIATGAAHRAVSPLAQYTALTVYVVAEALFFIPLLLFANLKAPGVISSAAVVTALGFMGLSAVAFTTRKDFSFLGALLRWVGFGAILAIFGGMFFGFQLGTWFTVGMIVFAGAAILYDTSNVIHQYPEDRHVAASLQLFASVMLLFWYVLRLFLRRD
ncbi:MAG: permease [Planctomycetota bacterium]|nr:MAG: permease [Planctomycetota bacterium]